MSATTKFTAKAVQANSCSPRDPSSQVRGFEPINLEHHEAAPEDFTAQCARVREATAELTLSRELIAASRTLELAETYTANARATYQRAKAALLAQRLLTREAA